MGTGEQHKATEYLVNLSYFSDTFRLITQTSSGSIIRWIIDKSSIKQCWRDSLAVYLLTGDD